MYKGQDFEATKSEFDKVMKFSKSIDPKSIRIAAIINTKKRLY